MTTYCSALTLDADWTEHGWEIAARFDAESCEGAWSGVQDDGLPEIVGPIIAQLLIADRDA